jgi:hypothetical protein
MTTDHNETPHEDRAAEKDAIRKMLPRGIYVLVHFGSEDAVTLVERDSSPATSSPTEGELVVHVEWRDSEYVLATGRGEKIGSGWELIDDFIGPFDTRSTAIDRAVELLRTETFEVH